MDKQNWQNLISQKGWWGAYAVYLSSSDWRVKRKKRLKIDNGECRTCGSSEDLEIHHKPQAYALIPNESVNDDLVTLCKICHEAITSSIRNRRYQDRDIEVQNHLEPITKELVSYGLENSAVQVNGRKPPDYAQWGLSEPVKSNCERAKEDFWQAKEDRRRFRGIG